MTHCYVLASVDDHIAADSYFHVCFFDCSRGTEKWKLPGLLNLMYVLYGSRLANRHPFDPDFHPAMA